MKALKTLIKVHKRNLDVLQRKIASLENQRAQLERLIERLQEELKQEIVLAGKTPEMGAFFGDFAKRIKTRQEQVYEEIASLEEKIAVVRDEIREAFSEIKKFEIALENALRRHKQEANRKEINELDEVAGQQHQRHKEEQ